MARKNNIEDLYPLSPMQQGILLHSLSSSEERPYFQQLSCLLWGDLDPVALKRAWQRVLDRHSILRTLFIWERGKEPVQVVLRQVELPWEQGDWRDLDREGQAERWGHLLRSDLERGLELSRAPLLRITLLRLGESVYRFLWSYHHLLLDGWSSGLVLEEVFRLYEAFRAGREASETASRPYGDYIAWLQRQDLREAEAFFRSELAAFTTPTPLGIDRRFGPAAGGEDVGEAHIELPAPVAEELAAAARRYRLTTSSFLQAAWALLLSRYSGEQDVVFGTTVSGRPAELEGVVSMVGLFINTLPLRIRVPPETLLAQWLEEIQVAQVRLRRYEHAPLSEIQKWSEIQRGLPLFESILVVEHDHFGQAFQNLEASLRIGDIQARERTNYPVTLLASVGQGLSLRLLYDARRFDGPTARRLLTHLETLLAGFGERLEGPLGQLDLLLPSERHQLLVEWNDTDLDEPIGGAIHHLFEAQADRTPAAVAVVVGKEVLTYGELEEKANRLAHLLRHVGAGPGSLVAVAMDRQAETIPALLAILKAGAAYVPLAASDPPARLCLILETLAVPVVLSGGSRLQTMLELASQIPAIRHLVAFDSEAVPRGSGHCRVWSFEEVWSFPAQRLAPTAGPEDIAYIIFTSGSTGAPKGVVVRHEPVINLIRWVNTTFSVGPADRVLFVSSLSFDLSVYDMFGLLAAGGSIHMASDDEVRDPERLALLLLQEPITYWDSAPAALQQVAPFLSQALPRGRQDRLRLVFLSGDWIPLSLPDRVRALFPQARVVSLGGATEATVWSNFFPVREIAPDWSSVPYGRPIRRAEYHVLDGDLRPCPIGIAGDLYIGGRCLASGYAGDPQRTAEKFIPDPFSTAPGARLYKTGDRVLYWPDGNLEFRGRLDQQVKIRGFRIELGEIEAVLGQHPNLREVVAQVRAGETGHLRLEAYFVARRPPVPESRELREFLAARLPEHMVPAVFVPLDALPVTVNGKLDRRALSAPEASAPSPAEDFAEPRTPAEQCLVTIWSEVLQVDKVGVHDNYFELGGDSILGIQIVARAGQSGLKLRPAQLFEHPTIAELATVVGHPPVAELHQGMVTGAVPLTPIQHWFFEQELSAPHHFNQALLLEVQEPLSSAILRRALAHLLVHHDALRLRFTPTDTNWTQHCAGFDGEVPCGVIDLSRLPEEKRRPALEAAASALQAGFDLVRGPLLRCAAFDLGAQAPAPARLFLVAHHLVIDGVSWRILLEDLETACRQIERGGEAALPPRTTSYREAAERFLEHAQAGAFDREIPYWSSASRLQTPRLPRDVSGGENTVAWSRTLSVALEPAETETLLMEAPRAYNTQINDVLLAALAGAFVRWTGVPALWVDLEGHGRQEISEDLDLSRTVGWFTAIFPVLLDLDGGVEPSERLRAVKEQLRRIPGQGVGYGALRYLHEDPSIPARLRSMPRAEVSFNYLGQLDQVLEASTLLRPAREASGPTHAPQQLRTHLLEVTGSVSNGRLRVSWTYGEQVHHRATIERLAEDFLSELRLLLDRCRSTAERISLTPSDFPLLDGLKQEQLAKIISHVRETKGSPHAPGKH